MELGAIIHRGAETPLSCIKEELQSEYILFIVNEKIYAIDILLISEIVFFEKGFCLPNNPDFFETTMDVRGSIIHVFSLKHLLKEERLDYEKESCVIVFKSYKGSIYGIHVDTVKSAIKIYREDIDFILGTTISKSVFRYKGLIVPIVSPYNILEMKEI